MNVIKLKTVIRGVQSNKHERARLDHLRIKQRLSYSSLLYLAARVTGSGITDLTQLSQAECNILIKLVTELTREDVAHLNTTKRNFKGRK
jgi:hypothetical protein